jgi:hypothetical protein
MPGVAQTSPLVLGRDWRDKRRSSFGVTGGEVSFACVIYIRRIEILSSGAAGRADVST